MILQHSALAVLLISYHPLKGVEFTLKLLIMISFLKYDTKQHRHIYIWIIDQAWDQDGYTLAMIVFYGFRNQAEGNKNAKENDAIIQPSWSKKLG